jgi:hypothetical protein
MSKDNFVDLCELLTGKFLLPTMCGFNGHDNAALPTTAYNVLSSVHKANTKIFFA